VLRCNPVYLTSEAADGKAATWAVCRLVRHRGIFEIAIIASDIATDPLWEVRSTAPQH